MRSGGTEGSPLRPQPMPSMGPEPLGYVPTVRPNCTIAPSASKWRELRTLLPSPYSKVSPRERVSLGLLRRRRPELNRRSGFCRPVPKPLGHVASGQSGRGADEGIRTLDLLHGKQTL